MRYNINGHGNHSLHHNNDGLQNCHCLHKYPHWSNGRMLLLYERKKLKTASLSSLNYILGKLVPVQNSSLPDAQKHDHNHHKYTRKLALFFLKSNLSINSKGGADYPHRDCCLNYKLLFVSNSKMICNQFLDFCHCSISVIANSSNLQDCSHWCL